MSQQRHRWHEDWQSTEMHHISALRTVARLISSLLHFWRGLFVSFYYWFGYYFFGFGQMPARVEALRMPA